MKRLLTYLLFGCLGIVGLSSCATVAKSYDMVPSSYSQSVAVDLTPTDKIYGEVEGKYFLCWRVKSPKKFAETGDAVSGYLGTFDFKSAAIYDAISKANVDYIINPVFTVNKQTKLFGLIKKYNVKVVGYGALKGETTVVEMK